jgi:hypothetical protein
MANIFGRLGYNFESTGDQVIEFSDKTIRTMNAVPKLLDDWQYEAVQNSDMDGYLQNPVQPITSSIISICSQIAANSVNVANLSTVLALASGISEVSGPEFIAHTDRISGLVEPISDEDPDVDTNLLPHLDTAMAVGKSLTYIINQSDGIQNNAPIMGSFTSILIEDDLTEQRNAIAGYPTLIEDSIYGEEFVGEPPELVRYSTLTEEQISEIESNLSIISGTLTTRRTHDENFFNNSKEVITDFSKMKKFKDMGQTEKNLTLNYIGTDKLNSKYSN